jgi:hypothetical protein
MALVKCGECGGAISDTAAACPQCGAPPKKKTSVLTWVIGAFVLYLVYHVTSLQIERSERVDTASAAAVPVVPAAPPAWRYSDTADKMTSKAVPRAMVRSVNSLSLQFPYAGSNYGELNVVQREGNVNVYLQFDKGQTMCRSYSRDCKIMVRFDDAKPIAFDGQGPSDGSSEAAFLLPASKFLDGAKKAKSIKVSLEIYKHGTQMFEFGPLAPLQWPMKRQ